MGRMKDLIAFTEGYKPALLTNVHNYNVDVLKEQYPHYTELQNGRIVIFFHGEEGKEWFEHNGVFEVADEFGRAKFKTFDQRVVGYALGYPPKAVEFFQKCHTDKEYFFHNKVGVDYYGIRFVTSIHTLTSDLLWLHVNRPVPKHLVGKIGITDFRFEKPIYYKVEHKLLHDEELKKNTDRLVRHLKIKGAKKDEQTTIRYSRA
jgi:hypothetical protein